MTLKMHVQLSIVYTNVQELKPKMVQVLRWGPYQHRFRSTFSWQQAFLLYWSLQIFL